MSEIVSFYDWYLEQRTKPKSEKSVGGSRHPNQNTISKVKSLPTDSKLTNPKDIEEEKSEKLSD